MIILTNPKVLLFFLAFLPQFIDQQDSIFKQYLVMTCTFVFIELCIEVSLALFAEKIAHQLSNSAAMNLFNKFTGGIFILAATYLAQAKQS